MMQPSSSANTISDNVEESRAALQRCPPGHSHRSTCLYHLAINLHNRFKQRGSLSDLDEAIEFHRAALSLRPPSHSLRSVSLNNLAISLFHRFEQQNGLSDLDEVIELHQAVLSLRPPGHSLRPVTLNNLGISILHRFEQGSSLFDLDEATDLHRAALSLCPPGHSERSTSLNALSITLQHRFKQKCVMSDLDEAIELRQAVLELGPRHSNPSMPLNSLAVCFQYRFQQLGVLSDLHEAIEFHRAALVLSPPGHPHRSTSLNNLANSLQVRFQQRGGLFDIDESIELHRAALELCPLGHPRRSSYLDDLAISLQDRSKHRDDMSDLNEAIELHRAALELRPLGHYDRSGSLHNLATSLHGKFKQLGYLPDLDEAIELLRAALPLRPIGHSLRSMSLDSLARSLRDRFTQRGVQSDLDEVFGLYSQLSQASHSLAVSVADLRAAKSWVISAEETKHGSALVAYQTALIFLDQLVIRLSPPSRNFNVVKEATSSLAVDAFSCGVRLGAFTTAVELVEQGRAVFWRQLARTPLDEPSLSGDNGAALAEDFKTLSFRLREAFDQSNEDHSPQIRQLTMQWDDAVSRIRMMPDFSRFLLPRQFSDFQKAAAEGPVIIVNASQYSCDALIILSGQDPIHVPLDITWSEISELSSEFQSYTVLLGVSEQVLVSILRKLWNHIVDPVVQALRESKVPPGSRIWWCPTAEFMLLPLHAAGPYEKNKSNLSHLYISSYTSTLTALLRARQQVSRDSSSQQFVAIGQGNPNNWSTLQHVALELAVVAQHVAPVVSFKSLSDSHATVQRVSDALSQTQWLHLACHGMPNRQQPFESYFVMRDGPIRIKDIIRSHWQHPEFAFLSSSHTTIGDEMSPDESINLAAAMQYSGFRSLIGSMGDVDDEAAHQVASAFYGKLIDSSGRLDCTQAAVALHKALKSLRKKIPLEQQIAFVHIGV